VVYGLVRSLKNEIVRVAPAGRVNAVCPGWTRTPMTRAALEDPTLVPRATRTMALRKLATADDVAPRWCCSPPTGPPATSPGRW
jgi:NAD(P)-dependent dehydrogenase (short-subunit alcohol dehydrogenase family)